MNLFPNLFHTSSWQRPGLIVSIRKAEIQSFYGEYVSYEGPVEKVFWFKSPLIRGCTYDGRVSGIEFTIVRDFSVSKSKVRIYVELAKKGGSQFIEEIYPDDEKEGAVVVKMMTGLI